MTRTITINTSALLKSNLSGLKEKITRKLCDLGAEKHPVEFAQLRKSVRNVAPKSLRARVRELRAQKIVAVKKAA